METVNNESFNSFNDVETVEEVKESILKAENREFKDEQLKNMQTKKTKNINKEDVIKSVPPRRSQRNLKNALKTGDTTKDLNIYKSVQCKRSHNLTFTENHTITTEVSVLKDSKVIKELEPTMKRRKSNVSEEMTVNENTSNSVLTVANILKHNRKFEDYELRDKSRSHNRSVLNKNGIVKTKLKSGKKKKYHDSLNKFKTYVQDLCTQLRNGQLKSPSVVKGVLKNSIFKKSKIKPFLRHKPKSTYKNVCHKCSLLFKDKYKLHQHYLEHTNEKDFFFKPLYELDIKRKYICELCASSFRDKFKLRDNFVQQPNNEMKLCCSICKSFK